MKARWFCSALIVIAAGATQAAEHKPRIYVTESGAAQGSGEAAMPEGKGSLSYTGGTSPQNVEVMKAFARGCPAVVVTASREKADYVVRLDHDEPNPTTPFVHGNKVAVFNRDEDLVYSNSTHTLGNAVKDACSAIARSSVK